MAAPLSESGKEFINRVFEQIDNPQNNIQSTRIATGVLCGLLDQLSELCGNNCISFFSTPLKKVLAQILQGGKPDKEFISNLCRERCILVRSFLSNLKHIAYLNTEEFRALLVQLGSILHSIDTASETLPQSLIIQIYTVTYSLVESTTKLCNTVATTNFLAVCFKDKRSDIESFEQGTPSKYSLPFIWDEPPVSPRSYSESLIRGTLNHLLIFLTESTPMSNYFFFFHFIFLYFDFCVY